MANTRDELDAMQAVELAGLPASSQQKPSLTQVRGYRITDEIAAGGMAVVYKGVQESLGRVVALKALKTSVSSDENVVARFEREALMVASFQHENLITLYDFFHERGALFMVMEYVEGIDLYDLLERCPQFPADVVAIVALQVARALDYAHFRGITHRDVKPANVILSKLGEVKLTDFGIARIKQSDLTETGVGLGTPSYMSPEQIVGDPMDHRTDIWSLGVVCYQMLAGRKPFVDGDDRSALQRIRLDEPTRLSVLHAGLPGQLEDILSKCMRKEPQERYGSAQELIVALQQYLAVHVHTNYRLRLVRFLRDQGVIRADATSSVLHPAMTGDYAMISGPSSSQRAGRLLGRPWVLGFGGVLIAALAGWAVGRWFSPAPVAAPIANIGHAAATQVTELQRAGQLRVLAHPWADVVVDGKVLATTPTADLISLRPGKHRVRLVNPYFAEETHVVVIKDGETTTLTVVLKRRVDMDKMPASKRK